MGKYENTLKQVQLRNLLSEKKYDKALEMAETMIGEKKANDVSELKLYADIFRKCKKFDKAKELYMEIYEEIHTRRVLYTLISLCIKSNDLNEADRLYKEYVLKDKRGADCHILRYRINKAKNADRETIIKDLEAIKKSDYTEEWAYELAKQYHKAGRIEECIEECRQIILWFSEGEIVERAKLLKMHHEGSISDDLMSGIEKSIGNDVSRYMNNQEEAYVPEQTFAENTITEAVAEEYPESTSETVTEETVPEAIVEDYSEVVADVIESPETELGDSEREYEKESVKLSSFAKYIDYRFGYNHFTEAKDVTKGNLSFVLASENQEIIMSTVHFISKMLDKFEIMKNPKIAKIDSVNLNNINLEDEVSNLIGTCMLVENASMMDMKTINSIIKVIDAYPDELAIILADKEENLSKMLFKEEILRNQLTHFILL